MYTQRLVGDLIYVDQLLSGLNLALCVALRAIGLCMTIDRVAGDGRSGVLGKNWGADRLVG